MVTDWEIFQNGERTEVQPQQDGPLAQLPSLPPVDASGTAAYIRDVLSGRLRVPAPIALQVAHILQELRHQPATETSRTAEVSPP